MARLRAPLPQPHPAAGLIRKTSRFWQALNSLGFSIDLAGAKALFGVFDIDGNGRIQVGGAQPSGP